MYNKVIILLTFRYLATGNSFNVLHFEFLLGATTIREIVKSTCQVIWNCMKADFMPEKREEDWLQIAKEFYERANFPHCLGAIDGKHIRICKPDKSGSQFFNYKSYFTNFHFISICCHYCNGL